MLWRGSREIGVGKAVKQDPAIGATRYVIVCHYFPGECTARLVSGSRPSYCILRALCAATELQSLSLLLWLYWIQRISLTLSLTAGNVLTQFIENVPPRK